MNELFNEKYITAEADESDLLHWEAMEHNRYGFVYVKNPKYPIEDSDREYLIRKPTPKERREIVINIIIRNSGKAFAVSDLADKLGVSERMMQTLLRSLQKEGLIEIIPKKDKNGAQKCNAYRYIGQPCKKYGSGLTLKLLYSTDTDVGFRDWAWKEHEFKHNKTWHSIYPLCKEKFKSRKARKKYLQRNGLPLIVPEEIRYLVLRYCYWKGKTEKLYRQNAFLYSKDGTIKIALEPLGRTERITFFEYILLVEIDGTKDNPKITITDEGTKDILGVFTWFDENIILGNKDIDEETTEQYFILGDFATR